MSQKISILMLCFLLMAHIAWAQEEGEAEDEPAEAPVVEDAGAPVNDIEIRSVAKDPASSPGQKTVRKEGRYNCQEAQDTLTRPTEAEINYTCKQVGQAFDEFIGLWKEEHYFRLYNLGRSSSQKEINTKEFATRMVELDWIPARLVLEDPLIISFRFKTFIYVASTIEFHHKTQTLLKFKKRRNFLLIWEDGSWRFDLLQMIRTPFYTAPNEATFE